MRKVGIITLFHGNINYGAVLQAYALCRVIGKLGYDCEQIDFVYGNRRPYKKLLIRVINFRRLVKYIKRNREYQKNKEVLFCRREVFDTFKKKNIACSKIYDRYELVNCIDDYECFVVGSDQVWNPDWLSPELLLSFVPATKTKISYAASIGKYMLSSSQKKIYENYLKSFNAVSVREKSAIPIIRELYDGPIEKTLDPTLLLNKNDWEEICSPRLVDEDYIFCYFLNGETTNKKIVKNFASKRGYKIVSIPHAYRYDYNDIGFADIDKVDASPGDFISLVRYATYVFTDSFHACVFSCIYQRQFWVFPRKDSVGMDARIDDILDQFNAHDHFLRNIEVSKSSNIIRDMSPIDYTIQEQYLKKKEQSIDFLKKYLK